MGVLLSSSVLETENHIFHCEHYKTLASTSDYLREQINKYPDHLPEGTVIVADNQTKGHGRYGRTWIAPEGNLNMSFLLYTQDIEKEQLPQLSFVLAIALREALCALHITLPVEYKWPNDILVNGKKVAGLLLESSAPDEWVVLSVGANIKKSPPQRDIEGEATSLHEEVGLEVSASTLRDEILCQFSHYYQQWRQIGFTPIRNLWLQHAKGIGSIITIRTETDSVSGKCVDMNEYGALIIQDKTGVETAISAGQVFLGE